MSKHDVRGSSSVHTVDKSKGGQSMDRIYIPAEGKNLRCQSMKEPMRPISGLVHAQLYAKIDIGLGVGLISHRRRCAWHWCTIMTRALDVRIPSVSLSRIESITVQHVVL